MSNETKEARRPSHEAFVVTGDDDSRKRWTKIGVVFTNKDGKGFNLLLEAVPLTGKIVILPFREKDGEDKGGQQ